MEIKPIDWQEVAAAAERLSPLYDLWEPLVERILQGTLRPKDLLAYCSQDIAMTVRLLIVGNSDQYGKPGQISTPSSALDYLGLDLAQGVVLATPCQEVSQQSLYGRRISYDPFWQHCLAAALFSRKLAEALLPKMMEEAFVAGLLHDIGKLLMNVYDSHTCSRIVPEPGCKALRLQEQEHFGVTHTEVADRILESFSLPESIRGPACRHHKDWNKLDFASENGLLTAVVTLGDYLTYQLELGEGGNLSRLMESPPKIERMGISPEQLEEVKRQGLQEYQEILATFYDGTVRLERQFQLLRRVSQVLGRRSLYLNKNLTELSRLQEVHEDLNRSLELDELLQHLAIRLGTIFSAEAMSFLLFLDEGPQIHYFSKIPLSEQFLEQSRSLLMEKSSSKKKDIEGIEPEVQMLIPDATGGRFKLKEVRSSLRLHLQGRDGQIGVLAFFSATANAFSKNEENLASLIAGEMALAIDRAIWMSRTQRLSITDELTGLFNHRRFMQILEHEFGRTRRYKNSLCLLMVDIDHFKQLNDTYGHQQGDRMLRGLAKILSKATRETDIVTRYGGEEFAIILPSTDLQGGRISAERIRRAVERHPFSHPGESPLKMTISVGVAQYTGENMNTPKDLIGLADKALYEAKREGRNRTVVYSADGEKARGKLKE